MIDGVHKVSLQRIPDERGTVHHMLKSTDDHFVGFGEIYFTTIYRDVVKGWHRHREMTLSYAVPMGRVKLVLFDDRADSATREQVEEHFLGPDDYSLVQIPPGVWNGFKGMTEVALVANCCTHPHGTSRSDRLDPFDNQIPYKWAMRHQ